MKDNNGVWGVGTYDEIQVLTGMEAIRKRPSMYVGELNSTAMVRLIVESMCLSRSRACSGEVKEIMLDVEEYGDNNYYVMLSDDAPMINDKDEHGMTTLEKVLEHLYACREMKTGETAHFCDLGLVVVNALSKTMLAGCGNETRKYKSGQLVEATEINLGVNYEFGLDFELDPEFFAGVKLDVAELTAAIDEVRKTTPADRKSVV